MAENNQEIEGKCICGRIRITVRDAQNDMGACHCATCRAWGGGPLITVESAGEVEISGREHLKVFSSSDWAERGFCGECGTHLFYRLKQNNHHYLPAGLYGELENRVFDHEIFIDHKPGYYSFANETKKLTAAEVFAAFATP